MTDRNNSENRVNVLRRTAKEVKHYKVWMKIMSASLAAIIVLLGLIYVWAVLYKKTGSFTVSVDKYDRTQYGLTLSESRDMTHSTAYLNARIVEDITNIAGETLPENIDMIDGEHNGENHIAYTFYLQNGGDVTLTYEYSCDISNITNDLDEAIRIRIYKDGEFATYAKTKSNGGGAEPGTVEFYSANVVALETVEDFKPNAVTKFTVVIWIEGNDPDCVDWLIGGEIKVEMNFNAVS